MDIRSVGGEFDALAARLTGARGEMVRAMGDAVAARQRLCAGLLVQAVLGRGAELSANAFGKPYIAGGPQISLSHAGDYAVLAVAREAVGVDIERARALKWHRLAARFFHAREAACLAEAADAADAFFSIWTLKESYIKAVGTGFATPMESFCVLPEGDGAHMEPETPYHFHRCPFADGYYLSLCALEADFDDNVTLLSARTNPI